MPDERNFDVLMTQISKLMYELEKKGKKDGDIKWDQIKNLWEAANEAMITLYSVLGKAGRPIKEKEKPDESTISSLRRSLSSDQICDGDKPWS